MNVKELIKKLDDLILEIEQVRMGELAYRHDLIFSLIKGSISLKDLNYEEFTEYYGKSNKYLKRFINELQEVDYN